MIKKLFGYWEVWHIVLSMILYMIVYRFLYIQNIDNRQFSFIVVMVIALLYEGTEFIWNRTGYKNLRHQFLNSMKDMLAALLGSVLCVLLLQ